jgi:hypothetical protein
MLHRLLGGEARVEDMVLRFIADRYGAAKPPEPAAASREGDHQSARRISSGPRNNTVNRNWDSE